MDDFDPSSRAAPIIVTERRGRIHGLFAFLAVVFAAALIRGHLGAETATGRIVADLVMGALLLGTVLTWRYLIHHPARLEITHDAISLAHRGGVRKQEIVRGGTGELFVRLSGGRHPQAYLGSPDSAERLMLWTFDRDEIVRACVACEWRFVD